MANVLFARGPASVQEASFSDDSPRLYGYGGILASAVHLVFGFRAFGPNPPPHPHCRFRQNAAGFRPLTLLGEPHT